MLPGTLLDRILWTQLARVLHGTPPPWDASSASARVIRRVLAEQELDPEEEGVLARWDPARDSVRRLFDQLLQARVNRALREGARIEARALGIEEVPELPRVMVLREGSQGGTLAASIHRTLGGKGTVVEFLDSSVDVVELEPGAKLDELVDLLVMADRKGAEELGESLGGSASVLRLEPEDEDALAPVDLLLEGPTPSIQVLDIERELARLEEVLRNAIPAERRPARSGTWSFGQDLTGETLGGKYRIRGLKGKGAFKTVYEGEDEMLGARVAIAVLNPKGARSPRALEHFQDEARKLTTLDHENIVRWITFDRSAEGLHYFVMEYLDGQELEKVLQREQRLAPKRVAAILLQVVAALRRAHGGKHGSLLHLDLKPENVFLLPALVPGEPERVKVIDFGIGQHVGAEVRAAEHPELKSIHDLPPEDLGKSIGSIALPEDDEEGEDAPRTLDDTGRRVRVERARGGTLLYASPEQCKHLAGHRDIEALDGRSDLYSLGVMAFRMLTGQFPFARITSVTEAITNHLEVPPRRVGSLGIKIPRDLAAFVDRCLVKDRARRWKDAGEAHEALTRMVHPRLSATKVAVPVGLVAALGLGGLYATRAPLQYGLTLVDPAASEVSARGVEELFLGPERPTLRLRLDPDAHWPEGTEVKLLDATREDERLAGWSVRWVPEEPGTVEVALESGARSAAARLAIDVDGGLGRDQRWRSERLALRHLGPWRIEQAGASGHDTTRSLDPRGHVLELEVSGDPEGSGALETIEIRIGDERLATGPAQPLEPREEHRAYAGPALDGLYTSRAHTVELEVLARDRAGQDQHARVALDVAGAPADFTADTGFVTGSGPDAKLLEASGETLLLPERALRLAVDAPGRARLFLEPEPRPVLEIARLDPGAPRVVSLAEVGIDGPSDRKGVLRLELDDEPFVARRRVEVRTRSLPFRYTPAAPDLRAQLVAGGSALALQEGAASVNPVRVPEDARLLVQAPPSANLWIEAQQDGEHAVRLARSGGAFELPLTLASEGVHEITVRKYVLGAGDERGPLIPPEHHWRLEVDRTAPRVALELPDLPGSNGASGAGAAPVYRLDRDPEGTAQHIGVRVEEPALTAVRWTLTGPGGASASGDLAPAAELALPSLLAHQTAEGAYALAVEARDRAGNVGRAEASWQVALAGPELTLIEPAASSGRWALGTGRAFDVRVRAVDANGVADVRLRLHRDGASQEWLALRRTGSDLWELAEAQRPSAFPWWSGGRLELELAAHDAAGLESLVHQEAIVPELPSTGALVIAPRDGRGPSATMVEILAGAEYVFGGRDGEIPRPLKVPIARGALRPYFLAAREVSRGEVLAFLHATDGFRDPRWWASGQAPEAARLQALEVALAGDPDRAATGLSWAEAQAYAAWCGLRLPTLLEWEFAVRGETYRLAPASSALPGVPVDWPANLCAGPLEWSATPEELVAEALDFASQCRRYPERLLAPEPLQGRAEDARAPRAPLQRMPEFCWVTGSVPGGPASFADRTTRASGRGHDDVGFRCAIDRQGAYGLLDRGEYVIID